MKSLILFTACLFNCLLFAQDDTLIDIQLLPKPDRLLYENYQEEIFRELDLNVEKSSMKDTSYVNYGDNTFLFGVRNAYRDHRPIVISPDVIWLLISQGFSRHISMNSEKFRDRIVGFKGKKKLQIISQNINLGDENSKWEEVFDQFESQIEEYTGKEYVQNLTSNFSTTDLDSKIASQITLFESVNKYFNYDVSSTSCGIPKVTVKGKLEDWQKIKSKLNYIKEFDLEWWTNELEPIIKEIIETKKGNVNLSFWKNILTYREAMECGESEDIDGWISKLYPFTKKGEKRRLDKISSNEFDDLAPEFVKVPFTFIDRKHNKMISMEFFAGIIVLKQDRLDFTLEPQVGWMINNKEKFDKPVRYFEGYEEIDNLSVKNVNFIPYEIWNVKRIDFLTIHFLDKINIDDELSLKTIKKLKLYGQISKSEIKKLKNKLKKTILIINNKKI